MKEISPTLVEILRCPETGERLKLSADGMLVAEESGRIYRISGGIPVLLSEHWTPFDFVESESLESAGFKPKLIRRIGKMLPPLDSNVGMKKALDAFFQASPKGGHCLVLGAGDNPRVDKKIAEHFERVTISDIVKGPNVDVICDGHALPFAENTFDAVVIVAVLEHVLSPEEVIGQLTRVLKECGVVYADTAFMQQIHMGRFDFSRFTDLGHRWLFRSYDEILRCNAGGPGAGLAWAITYFFLSFCGQRQTLRLLVRVVVRLLFFWVHYFDYVLQHISSSRDGASGVIFVGKNRKQPQVSPRELITQYVGGF